MAADNCNLVPWFIRRPPSTYCSLCLLYFRRSSFVGLALLSAVALACKQSFRPHVDNSMKVLLVLMQPSYADVTIRGRAIESAGQIAASVGAEGFGPYVLKVSQLLTASLRQDQGDPSLVEMVYTCFSNFAVALKEKLGPIMGSIVETILKDLGTKDLIQLQFERGMAGEFEEEEQDEDKYKQKVRTRDAIVDKRAAGLQALGSLATFCGAHMRQFSLNCIKEALENLDYPSIIVNRAAITAVTALLLNTYSNLPVCLSCSLAPKLRSR